MPMDLESSDPISIFSSMHLTIVLGDESGVLRVPWFMSLHTMSDNSVNRVIAELLRASSFPSSISEAEAVVDIVSC